MKKIILGLSFMLLLSMNVNALEITDETDFNTCISTSNTCVLQNDLGLSEKKVIEDGKDITLDLNGYEITYSGADLIKQGLIVVNHGAKLTINDSNNTGKINPGNNTYGAIGLTNVDDTNNSKVAELVINGGNIIGNYYAIVGNGNAGRDNTKITINGGKIEGSYPGDNLGIYQPQNGLITVNGGTISAVTGIEIRAGKLIVNGGKIVGNSTSLVMDSNGSGSTTIGAGIAVMQHTTSLPTELEINDGTIEGFAAVAQKKVEASADDSLVTIKLNGGTYNTLNGGTEAVYSETKTAFIKGGTYSTSLSSSYIPDDYKVEEKNSKYVVSAIKSVEATTTEGTVTFETEDTLDKDYVLVVTEKDSNNKTEVENKVKDLLKDDKSKTDTKLISLLEINVEDGSGQVVPMADGNFKISIPVSENMRHFSTYKSIYVDSNNNIVETIDASLVNNNVIFNTSHLSTYGIIGYNETNLNLNNEVNSKTNNESNLNLVNELNSKAVIEPNPQTGDHIISSIVLGLVSLISVIFCMLFIKKDKLS